jgi:hypothetical protein
MKAMISLFMWLRVASLCSLHVEDVVQRLGVEEKADPPQEPPFFLLITPNTLITFLSIYNNRFNLIIQYRPI